jgi:integrase
MPTIRERGGQFHVQVRMTGFPARTGSFPTRRLAERWAKTIEAEMIEGRHFRTAEARRRTMGEAIDRYTIEELPKKRGGGMHRAALAWWKKHIGSRKMSDVTPSVIVEQLSRLAAEPFTRAKPGAKRSLLKPGEIANEFKRSPATVDRYHAVGSHVFTVARKDWHWVGYNPFEAVRKSRSSRGRIRHLSTDERDRLLTETAKNPTLHLLVMLALSTAARAGELLNLLWRDVDIGEGRLIFRETKNGEPREAWLLEEALRLVKQRAQSLPNPNLKMFTSASGATYDYGTPFKDAVKAAGIADFRFHDLRHTAATALAREGASEQQLKAIGGWKSGIVSRYVHIASNDARAVMERMNKKITGIESKDGRAVS